MRRLLRCLAFDIDYNTIKHCMLIKKYSPTVDTLYKMANVLRVSIVELVEEVPDDTLENSDK